jgi:signal transduction histidine kinase
VASGGKTQQHEGVHRIMRAENSNVTPLVTGTMEKAAAASAPSLPSPVKGSENYVQAMERLIVVVQDLSRAHDLESLMLIIRKAARDLTGADGATLVLKDGDYCFYAEENAISPLWKGQRFPMKNCISGWVMMHAEPAVIEDIYQDPRIPHDAYRPTFVKSLAMVPIRRENPVGAIGNYWAKNHLPSEEEVAILQALANVTSIALENVELYNNLQRSLLALKKSNEDLSSFAWIAAHDLKSPLRAIDTLSLWIEDDLRGSSLGETKTYLDTLRRRVRRMEKLLDDILEYVHLEHASGTRREEIVDGRTLLGDIVSLVHMPPGFTLKVAEGFENIQVPRLALQRIFCNLVDNAIKHHHKKTGLVEIGFEDQGAQYMFTVSDDGPGIEPRYRQRVFDMLTTLQPRDSREGSGMGLALVKKVVLSFGGDIAVEGTPGYGAVFRFTIPKIWVMKDRKGAREP